MRMTVEEYAALRGVSPGTIRWMTTPPEARPSCEAYIGGLAEVFTSIRRYAALLGVSDNSVRYQMQRGLLVPGENGGIGVHLTDQTWGLARFDREAQTQWWNKEDRAVAATCFYQAVERELIRLGHLPPDGLVEAQLKCTARSPEWWRRQRLKAEGTRAASEPWKLGL
jgi:hypothetical protein